MKKNDAFHVSEAWHDPSFFSIDEKRLIMKIFSLHFRENNGIPSYTSYFYTFTRELERPLK